MYYLAIPKSEMCRLEVKSLLGETSPDKEKENKTNRSDSKEEPFIPPPAKIKQEPDTNPSKTVLAEDVEKTVSPVQPLDPSVVPEGEGMVDG